MSSSWRRQCPSPLLCFAFIAFRVKPIHSLHPTTRGGGGECSTFPLYEREVVTVMLPVNHDASPTLGHSSNALSWLAALLLALTMKVEL